MNQQALTLIYDHLKTLTPEALAALKALNANFGKLLPPQVEAFEQEAEFALTTFTQWGPLIEQLLPLVPAAQ
jgi:hypothetical protein